MSQPGGPGAPAGSVEPRRDAAASLEAEVEVRLGRLDLGVELALASGELVVLLGPNGAGKTTLLRAVAGLVPLRRGRVVLDGMVLDDATSGEHVPTERRPIGFVFQDYLLFPHLSSLENVAFGLRARGVPRAEARRRAAAWLDRVGLAGHAGSRPRALSGGQAQRVALARAMVADPRLLLLDEPLAALDAASRAEVRRDLRRHLASFDGTRLLVTHDPLEPEGTPRNVWPGTSDTLEVLGDRVRVRVLGPVPVVAEVTSAAAAELRLADGGLVWATVKATEVVVYPA